MDNSRAARAHVSHQRAKASNTTSTIGSTTTRPVSGLRPVYDKCFSFHFRSDLAIRVTLRSFETSQITRSRQRSSGLYKLHLVAQQRAVVRCRGLRPLLSFLLGAQLLLDGLCLHEERLTIGLRRCQPLGPHRLGFP